MEGKQRIPEMSTLIKDIGNEYTEIMKDNPSHIMFYKKLNNFMTLVDEKLGSKCSNEIEKVKELHTLKENTLTAIPGKEKESKEAILALNECQSSLMNYVNIANSLSEYNVNLIDRQINSCFDDCENNFKVDNSNEMRTCVRNCYNFTINYTVNSIQKITGSTIEEFSKEIRKI